MKLAELGCGSLSSQFRHDHSNVFSVSDTEPEDLALFGELSAWVPGLRKLVNVNFGGRTVHESGVPLQVGNDLLFLLFNLF